MMFKREDVQLLLHSVTLKWWQVKLVMCFLQEVVFFCWKKEVEAPCYTHNDNTDSHD